MPLTASEVIEELQRLIKHHGDLTVEVRNAAGDVDTAETVEFNQQHRSHTIIIET
jgi:hypothetical protein